jgi:cell fate regulator YaaT (PSP1 superfamily)
MNDNYIGEVTSPLNTVKELKATERTRHVCDTRCCKLEAYNWLKDIPFPEEKTPFYFTEVRFKYNRREFFSYDPALELQEGDVVAVETDQGHDIGIISLMGEVVRLQMQRKGVTPSATFKKVYRKARIQDIERWIQSIDRESKTLTQTRQIIRDLQLDMKLDDLEFRGDGMKAIFYYTAAKRIDFRELIKILAERFRIKVEMRQIGIRQEAAKVGGIGSCGREMCCSTWVSSFQSVSTQSARTQQIPINPQKLAGQCGKLKCCLNYEQDTYVDVMRYFPANTIRLRSKQGVATFVKADVFKKRLTYSYHDEHDISKMVELPVVSVWKIIKLNEQSKFPDKFEDFISEAVADEKIEFQKVNQDDLNRFDKRKRQRDKQKDNKKRGRNG